MRTGKRWAVAETLGATALALILSCCAGPIHAAPKAGPPPTTSGAGAAYQHLVKTHSQLQHSISQYWTVPGDASVSDDAAYADRLARLGLVVGYLDGWVQEIQADRQQILTGGQWPSWTALDGYSEAVDGWAKVEQQKLRVSLACRTNEDPDLCAEDQRILLGADWLSGTKALSAATDKLTRESADFAEGR